LPYPVERRRHCWSSDALFRNRPTPSPESRRSCFRARRSTGEIARVLAVGQYQEPRLGDPVEDSAARPQPDSFVRHSPRARGLTG
jgi:hypothetical protein